MDMTFYIKFVELLLETFRQTFTHTREVSVDEGMIKYAGRLYIKQYVLSKKSSESVDVM